MPTEPSAEDEVIRVAVEAYEAPYVKRLRAICEEIGYGRVIQLAENWMDAKHPGWLASHHKVNCEYNHDCDGPVPHAHHDGEAAMWLPRIR